MIGCLVEEARSRVSHIWTDSKAEIIQQHIAEQRSLQPGAAGNPDILAGQLLDLRELGWQVTFEEKGAKPLFMIL